MLSASLCCHSGNHDLTDVIALQCELMIRQGLVRRVFGEWQRLCQERDWKTQLATRDNEIKRMDREVCQAEHHLSHTGSLFVVLCIASYMVKSTIKYSQVADTVHGGLFCCHEVSAVINLCCDHCETDLCLQCT